MDNLKIADELLKIERGLREVVAQTSEHIENIKKLVNELAGEEDVEDNEKNQNEPE